ncbi:MAG: TonB-dependent receptor domain-containing protein [Aestuariibaculum sp.]
MKLFYVVILMVSITLSAQNQKIVHGEVIDFESNTPLESVTIVNIKDNKWTITDKNGRFSLKIIGNNIELKIQQLGKKTQFVTAKDITANYIKVFLKNEDLRLDEVMVTAIPKRNKIGSAIVLDEYAVNQVQAYSLADILNQLPGQDITPPSLNTSNTISLRTAAPNNSLNAFGVSYILDGMQLSNDENMQTYRGATLNSNLTDYDNANTGIDLRTIPAANIDEVEVISGIPDAKYGNLTSGVIKINRKAGVTPYRVSANIRGGTTSVSFGKGFKLNDKWGDLSISLDYLNSNADPRNSLEQYDRITTSGIWSMYNKNKTIKNTLSLTLHNNFDDKNYDKDNDDGGKEIASKTDRGFKISNRFSKQFDTAFIDHFNFNTGFSYTYQHSYRQSFYNFGGNVIPTAIETSLYTGKYTPVSYLQIKQTYGQPINFNTSFSIDKSLETEKFRHNMSLGTNFSISDNKGKGRGYDPANAHTQLTINTSGASVSSKEGFRPLDYGKYVKPRYNFGIYVQDNITYTMNSGHDIFANIGFRFDNQNGFSSFSPRINLGTEITNQFSIRGGLGFATKAPSLSQIFPGDRYFDILIRDFRTSYYSFNLIQTYKEEINKQNIKPSKSWKYEIGLNYNPSFGSFSLTGYHNYTYDGVTSYSKFSLVDFPEVEFTFADPQSPPTYEVTGYSPFLLDYTLNTNANFVKDTGIEFFANFKKIEAINTSFSLNGSYVYSNSSSKLDYTKANINKLNVSLPYGIYQKKPIKNDALRLRGTITHHLSDIGLLISLTAEQYTRNTVYATTSSIYPIGYINEYGETIYISESKSQLDEYKDLWLNPSTTEDVITPIYHNFHLRITKEMLNGISMSLYANNFLNYHPLIKDSKGNESTKNPNISFGANIQYKF